VQHAHERGVVHRDLKPANVLLASGGQLSTQYSVLSTENAPARRVRAKIADFGLAKQLDIADGRTRTGAVMGTPSYMAPEQAAGKVREMGPGIDVYALGAILYECLTGRPPFKGTSVTETLDMVRRREWSRPPPATAHAARSGNHLSEMSSQRAASALRLGGRAGR
jgi:serine/threonine protein kinase